MSILFRIILPTLLISLYFNNEKRFEYKAPVLYQFENPDTNFWIEIKTLETKGLYQTALGKVLIYEQQQIDQKNWNEAFRALTHKSKYYGILEESASQFVFEKLLKSIQQYPKPYSNIIHSILAEFLSNTVFNKSYGNNIPDTDVEIKDLNLSNWNKRKFQNEIAYHLLAAIDFDKKCNLKISEISFLAYFDPEAHIGLEVINQLLCIRTISILQSLQKVGYFQKIEYDPNLALMKKPLAVNVDSIKFNIKTLKAPILDLYAWMLSQSKSDKEKIRLSLMLLEWAAAQFPLEAKEHLQTALEMLQTQYKGSPYVAYAIVESAKHQLSNERSPASMNYIIANDKLNIAKEINPEIESYNIYQQVYSDIHTQNLNLTGEKQYLSNQPNLISVRYRNFKKLNLYIYEWNPSFDKSENYIEPQELKNKYSAEKLLQVSEKYVFQKNDFVEHSIEFPILPLKQGKYRIFAVANEGESDEMIATQIFHFSNLILNVSGLFHEVTFSVHEASTGALRKNALVEVFEVRYNMPNRKIATFNTGRKGFKSIKLGERKYYNNLYEFIIRSEKDTAFFSEYIYTYSNYSGKPETRHEIFTNRSIYRPGQKVHFKVISYSGMENNFRVNARQKIAATFFDANHQKIGEIAQITNEFGSIEGVFSIPENVLSGIFTIQTEKGYKSIKVEEYKRASFEVVLNQPEGAAKLDEKITVKGIAKAFSGVAIDGAKGSYKVVRKAPRRWWWIDADNQGDEQVAQGAFSTNSDGGFEITFIAKTPANNLSKNRNYQYWIEVVVTDAAGETRTANISIGAADVPFQIQYEGSPFISDDQKSIIIKTQTLAGKPTDTELKVEVQRILPIDKIRPNRPWQTPDVFLKDSLYLVKNPIYHHPALEKKLTLNKIMSPCNGEVEFELTKLGLTEQGSYFLNITATQKGIKTQTVIPVTLLRKNSNKPLNNEPLLVYQEQEKYEPGETAEILLSTPIKNAKIFYQIECNKKLEKQEWITLNSESKTLKIPIEEKHRGGLNISFVMVYNNRVYIRSAYIQVPYSNKKLKVELLTLKEKFAPGAQEVFKLRVSGFDSQAELLASMYDKMLDIFAPHQWHFQPYSVSHPHLRVLNFYGKTNGDIRSLFPKFNTVKGLGIPQFNWQIEPEYVYDYFIDAIQLSETVTTKRQGARINPGAKTTEALREEPIMLYEDNQESTIKREELAKLSSGTVNEQAELSPNFDNVKIRSNFNETVFFFPQIMVKDSVVEFSFKLPESLSRWKLQILAHTQDLKIGQLTHEIVTQKELMVQSYAPRFLREDDSLILTAKIVNLLDNQTDINVKLKLENIVSGEEIKVHNAIQALKIGGSTTEQVSWKIKVGSDVSAIRYTILAQSESHSDAEQGIIPILPNNFTLFKTLAFYTEAQSGLNKIKFGGDKILSNPKNRALSYTLEYTPNPAWYVVASLPYLTEFPHECAEQTFHRIYAVKLAEKIFTQNPELEKMLQTWEKLSPDVLTSNLEKNPELKNIVLEETNWQLRAQNETASKKRISLLTDPNYRNKIYDKGIKTLTQLQKPSGGWPWFKGMDENLYITQVILAGEGKLRKLGMGILTDESVNKALEYCDSEYQKMYNKMLEHKTDTANHLPSPTFVQYLYVKSFYNHTPKVSYKTAQDFYESKTLKNWLSYNEYMQATISIALHRKGNISSAKNIMASLRERAIVHPELGMYWKSFNQPKYYWHRSNIESAAMLAQAFEEVANDKKAVLLIQKYLLNHKRTNAWDNTKSTADACFVFITGNKAFAGIAQPKFKIGNLTIDPKEAQPGTGYIKKNFEKAEISPEKFELEIENKSEVQGWGGIYLKYEAPADEAEANSSGLTLKREIFLVKNDNKGERLISLHNQKLSRGDKLECRLTFTTNREMEYVHLRDPRPANVEPEFLPSGYRYKDGISYYFSIKDAATNFFISKLHKGQYTLSYRMFITHEGNFSIAPATIQSMYAPEFASNSLGERIIVF